MKIKKLTIHNIASVEDAVIDFTGNVLGNEPLFLITGETGSGKTTILNAICLALYNTAPNIEDVQNAQNAAKIGGVSINDPLQLMRQGTYDANVELIFDGNDGYEYVASWVAHRAKNYNPQPVKISLTCQHTQLSIQKKREMTAAIGSPNVVGLTYEQFCRTTMLAQGQFSKFMASKDDDKSDILEKLTGTDLYARIGEKVHERQKKVDADLIAITNRIAGAKLLTIEEREELNEKINQVLKDLEEQQKLLNEVTQKHEWLKSAEAVRSSRKTKVEKLETMKAQLDDEHIKAHAATVSLWDKTADIRNTLKGMSEKNSQLAASKNMLGEKQTEFVSFVAGLEFVKCELADVNAEIDALKAMQKAESEHADMYANIQRIETLIDTILGKREAIKTQDDRIARAEKQQQAKAGPQAKAEAVVKETEDALALAHKTVEEKTAIAKGVNINALREVVNSNEKDGKLVNDCIDAMANLRKKIQAKNAADEALAGFKSQIADASKQKEEQEALLPEAKKEAEALSNQLKGKMDLRSHLVELQVRFHDTGTCPLCGSAVDGIHSESILDEEVAKAKAAATKAENRQKSIEKNIREAETVLKTMKKLLGSAKKTFAEATSDEEKAKQSASELLSKFQFKWDDVDLDKHLHSLKEAYDKALADAKQNLADGQAKLDAIEPARKDEYSKRNALEKAKAKLDEIKESVKAIESDIRDAKTLRQQALEDVNVAFAALSPLVKKSDVELQYADLKALKTDIKGRAEAFAKNADKIHSDEQKSHDLNKTIETVTPTMTELAVVLDVQTGTSAKELKGLEQKLRTFNVEVTKLNGSINTLKRQLAADEEISKTFFRTHGDIDKSSVVALLNITADDIQNYREEKRKIEDEIKQTEGAIKQIDGQLAELDQHKPELQEEETLEVLAATKTGKEELIKLLNIQKVESETRLKDDAQNAKDLATHIQEKDRLQLLAAKWKVLNDAFGGPNGTRFKRIAQSYVLRSLLQKANYYLRMLNTRYELACTDGSLSISILDHAQGGAERNVSSLSGGEGFVVSLALALGLSAISKDKINVDTLFIDEGFGTLSGDYLETVITTLDKLHQLGGRRVGIISHVAELANRIPTQIKLVRTGPSSSKIEIVSQ